ncbi:MAG TPA: NAD(P)/FAD-dependent oxidoreductase [Solirubrobacteraceae bacterium]|nr:NAD(P)/FAD-dependent oxidoreductase [Solirubrobacteraceae bacterium]
MADAPDALVIGAGPNGLVAANVLADAGWSVEVLEAQPEPGGAVRSGELTLPGYVHDRFSSFYPLGVASPAMRAMDLEAHGVSWRYPELPVAHPASDGSVAYVGRDVEETAAALRAFDPADGDAWRRLYAHWERLGDALLDALFAPFPPLRGGLRLARRLGRRGALDFARFGLLPVRRLGEEWFAGEGGRRLLAGNALHADFSPEHPGGGIYGWVLVGLAQQFGFPVPEGGSGRVTDALVRRLRQRGGRVRCDARVDEIVVRRGRAVGVRIAGGEGVGARRAVLADVSAPALYLELLDRGHVPARVLSALERFQRGNATFKVDWALDGPVPWLAGETARAGTVHITESVDELTRTAAQLILREVPSAPFLVCGQYARTDPTRAPAGKEVFWSYTHVPQAVVGDAGGAGITGAWDERESERFADRIAEQIERVAPGFRDRVAARAITTPQDFEAQDANLVGGALNGGTAELHQQLVLRPIPGLGRAETPVPGLYLASASAHPGGGVHGGCGAIAARAALREPGVARRLSARAARAVSGRAI